MFWNLHSLLNEVKLQSVLQVLDDNDIQIACLCETWFDSDNGKHTKAIKDAGYEIKHCCRKNKGGGGTAIIYSSSLKVKPGDASESKYESFEYSYIKIQQTPKTNILLICIYRKQEISFKIFGEEIEFFLDEMVKMGDEMIVVGDFNVWTDVKTNSNAKNLSKLMSGYGLKQYINGPTQIHGHTLDHLYFNEEETNVQDKVIHGTFDVSTDHYACTFKIPPLPNNNKKETISYRNTKNIDMVKFIEELKIRTRDIDFTDNNFKSCYDEYKNISEKLLDEVAPVKIRTITSDNKPKWIDEEYRKSRIERRKLERVWKKNKTVENREKYVEQRKKCAELSVRKQQEYYSHLIDSSSDNQNSLFKVVEKVLDRKSQRILPEHTDPVKLANEFNKFYVDKISKLRESIPENKGYESVMKKFNGEKLEVFHPTTVEELKTIIQKFGIKASAEDPLPTHVLKNIMDEMLPMYNVLVNKSLSEGSMDGIKHSVIDPLLKKDGLDPEIRKNFRPVNNLVFLSKLIERVASRRIDNHMAKNNLHNKKQFAYKEFHSTETMMTGVVSDVLKGFDENKCTVMVFLDLSAAFDTIDIEKFLTIMSDEIGLSGSALQWCRSFLTNRTQRVKINGHYSDSIEVKYGAPQGSVWGPKCYNIYVRGQPVVIQNCGFQSTAFADDSNGKKKFAITFQYNVLKHDIPALLNEITNWMNSQGLKINKEKTEIIVFYPKSLKNQVIIGGTIIGEECIRFSKEVKNVGVWLDEQLNLEKHINQIVSHCYKLLRDIGRIRNILSKKHTETLIHAVISSRIDYCNSLFMNLNKSSIYKLQKVQNSAARMIERMKKHQSVSETMKNLHWLNVEARIMFKILLLVHKCITNKCSENLEITYKNYNCRPQDDMQLVAYNPKTKYGKRVFDYTGPRLWNVLPLNIRTETNINKFKTNVKTILFERDVELKKTGFNLN